MTECRVHFYSGAMLNRRLGAKGSLAIFLLGEDKARWTATGEALSRRGRQSYSFKVITRDHFQVMQ